jgi:ribonuclease M5
MFHKKSIIDVIIVEGKSDTKKLQKIFNVDTIETNGSALSEHTINLIKNVSKIRPIILFLDPDGPGEKIRKKLEKVLTVYKQAFIKHNTITSKKFGVAEATDKQIMDALSCVVNFDSTKNSVT